MEVILAPPGYAIGGAGVAPAVIGISNSPAGATECPAETRFKTAL
jgi:hypothetical protein